NRTVENAREIVKTKPQGTSTKVMTIDEAARVLNQYKVIIQTTSVGMKPHEEQLIMNVEHMREGSIASDIVYQPIKTKFLKEAKKKGASIHFGHTMLLHQAQYALEIWTGNKVSTKGMHQQLQRMLEEGKTLLTGKQKRYLRSEAHHLKPIFQVGKTGVNENMITQINEALEKRELIKVSILQNCLDDKHTVSEQIRQGTGAEI